MLDPKRQTVASFLQTQGYYTGVVGKWHLGWDWANINAGKEKVDFSKPIQNGPNAFGFDYSNCIIGSLDMNPYAYVENGICTTIPVDTCATEKGVQFYRAGMVAPDFKHEEVLKVVLLNTLIKVQPTDTQHTVPQLHLPAPRFP